MFRFIFVCPVRRFLLALRLQDIWNLFSFERRHFVDEESNEHVSAVRSRRRRWQQLPHWATTETESVRKWPAAN